MHSFFYKKKNCFYSFLFFFKSKIGHLTIALFIIGKCLRSLFLTQVQTFTVVSRRKYANISTTGQNYDY